MFVVIVRKLIWDSWNIAHIARHDVTPEEVDQVCQNDPVVQEGKKGRILVIGSTENERILIVILDPEEEKDVYYPVTAYTASKRLRQVYFKEKGGGKK